MVVVVGDVLELTGLVTRAGLNGQMARIVAHDPLNDLWHAFVEGEPKKLAVKAENLKPNASVDKVATVPGAAMRRAQRTTRHQRTERRSPDGSGALSSGGESSSGGGPRTKSRTARGPKKQLTAVEREAALSRLYAAPRAGAGVPRPKAPRTERPKESDFDPLSSTADDGTGVVPIDERPPFVVPVGKRRTQATAGRAERPARTDRIKPTTYRGSPTTHTALNRANRKGMTTSPSGRGHPDEHRRNDVRRADMHTNINYYATARHATAMSNTGDNYYTAPDNDQKMKEASWLTSQAWFESLRHYPSGANAIDSEAAYSGLTHGGEVPSEHLETDVRTRLGIAVADPDWRPNQLQEAWAPERSALKVKVAKAKAVEG